MAFPPLFHDNRLPVPRIIAMKTTWRMKVFVLAVFSLLDATPLPASADDPGYEKVIADGVAEFERGNYPEAKVLFRMAHDLNPNARTLRGMGMTAFEMREYVDASRLLELALLNEKKPLTEEQRENVEGLITRARAFIATYVVKLVPPDAEIKVDGASTRAENGRLLLNPGEHELVVKADGYRGLTRRVRAEAGKRESLDLELEREPGTAAGLVPAPKPAASVEPAPTRGQEPAVLPSRPGRPGDRPDARPPTESPLEAEAGSTAATQAKVWTWVAAGGAVASAGAAGVFWALANGEASDVEEECKRHSCPTLASVQAVADDTSLKTYETLTTVSLALSGAALVGFGALFFVEGAPDVESDNLTVGVGPTWLLFRGHL